MGILKINGVDIRNYATAVDNLQGRTESPLTTDSRFKNILIGTNETTSNSSKKLATAWEYDAMESKLKINGVPVTVAYDGTRPINKEVAKISLRGNGKKGVPGSCWAEGLTYRLMNKDGELYYSKVGTNTSSFDDPIESSGVQMQIGTGITSKHPDKLIVVNILMTGGGGAGGCGAYFTIFIPPSGDDGGGGGGAGARAFFTLKIKNNESYIIFAPYAGTLNGVTRNVGGVMDNSGQVSNAQFSSIRKDGSNIDLIYCNGGINGVSHRRHNPDETINIQAPFAQSTPLGNIILRKKADGQHKVSKGSGLSSTSFINVPAP